MIAMSDSRDRYTITFRNLRPEEAIETIRLSLQAQNSEPYRPIEIERFMNTGDNFEFATSYMSTAVPPAAPDEAPRPDVAAGLRLGVGLIDSGTIRLWAGLYHAGEIDPITLEDRVHSIYVNAFPKDAGSLMLYESVRDHMRSVGADTARIDGIIEKMKEEAAKIASQPPVLDTEQLKSGDRVSWNKGGSYSSLTTPTKEYLVKEVTIYEAERGRTVMLSITETGSTAIIRGPVAPNTLWNVIARETPPLDTPF